MTTRNIAFNTFVIDPKQKPLAVISFAGHKLRRVITAVIPDR